jgi:hypothetical protein
MAGRLRGTGQDNTSSHRFLARNASNQVWRTDTSVFEAWNDANIATYGITATRQGTSTYYTGDEPANAVTFELWFWTGALATSYPVYDGTLAIPNAPSGASGGLPTSTDSVGRVNVGKIMTLTPAMTDNGDGTGTVVAEVSSLPGYATLYVTGVSITAATATTVTLGNTSITSTLDLTDHNVKVYSGTGIGQVRRITDYDIPTRVATIDRAWDVTPNPANSLVTIIGGAATGGDAAAGTGDKPVTHNTNPATGGVLADALRYTFGGNGVDDVVIQAYLASEYDAGNPALKGTTRTGPDGRWLAPLMLNAGSYKLVARLPGVTRAAVTDLTVV